MLQCYNFFKKKYNIYISKPYGFDFDIRKSFKKSFVTVTTLIFGLKR